MILWVRNLDRNQLGWLTILHVVLAGLSPTLGVTWQVSSGLAGPGGCQSQVCCLSGLPESSSLQCPLQQASLGLLSGAQHSMRVRSEAVKPLDIYTWEECDVISVSLYWTKQVPTS